MFAGNGIRLARAERQFTELKQRLKIPVVATWCAADLISKRRSHSTSVVLERWRRVGRTSPCRTAIFFLTIGVRLDFAITGYAPEKLAREAHKVMVDVVSG